MKYSNSPPGPKSAALQAANMSITSWKLFFTDDIFNEILHATSTEKYSSTQQYREEHPNANIFEIDFLDLLAYIGIRYNIGKERNNKLTADSFWNNNYGNHLCKAAMIRQKFLFIHKMLCFDNIADHIEWHERDKFAAM